MCENPKVLITDQSNDGHRGVGARAVEMRCLTERLFQRFWYSPAGAGRLLSKWHHLCEQGMCKSTRGRRISPSRATIEASEMAAKIICPVSTNNPILFVSWVFTMASPIIGESPSYSSESGNNCQLTESKSCRRTFTLYGVCNRFKHRLNYSEAKSRTLQTAIRG